MGFLMPRDGYGEGTIKIGGLLAGRGWDVIDMRTPAGTLGTADADRRSWWLDGDVVALCQPDWLPNIDAGGRLVSYTMFEATRLPEGWAESINRRAAAVMVPCAWNVEVFRESGVRVPVHVVKWGVDAREYSPIRNYELGIPNSQFSILNSRPYTFLWSGTPDRRKGWDLAYRCFVRAFGRNTDVRLVLHFRKRPPGLTGCLDPNVTIVEGVVDKPALRSMLRRADAFVFPSRGEGWGAPPREAAATGLPVIATNWGGLAEEIEAWAYPLRVAGMSRAEFGIWDEVGEWAEPDPEHLIELYRWVFSHQEEAAAFGLQAAGWLFENAGWERTARGVAGVMGVWY